MNELPTLTVDDSWHQAWVNAQPTTDPWQLTVRIDGDLPTVVELIFPTDHQRRLSWLQLKSLARPLRVGDRVTLVTFCEACIDVGGPTPVESDNGTCGPFATATVASLERTTRVLEWPDKHGWLVTVTEVEALMLAMPKWRHWMWGTALT